VLITAKSAEGDYVRRLTFCPPRPLPIRPVPILIQSHEGSPIPDDGLSPFLPFDRCIPIPPPRPREPRSQAENFIERLWAFKTIKELLDDRPTNTQIRREELANDDDTAEVDEDEIVTSTTPEPKSNRQKALDLALEYNFVTPITSLVVVRPNGTEDENATLVVDPVPLASIPPSYGYASGASFRRQSFGGRRPVMAASPARPPPGVFSRMSPSSSSQGGGSVVRTSLLSGAPVYDSYVDEDMDGGYGVDYSGNYFTTSTTTTTRRTSCSGRVLLYTSSYRRGDAFPLDGDQRDLAAAGLSDRIRSLDVEGEEESGCCWRLFTLADFGGESQIFRPGKHDSPSKLGPFLLSPVGSVQRVVDC